MQPVNFGKNQFHISNTHFKGETKTYYVCIGKTYYSGQAKQQKAIINGAFAFNSIRYINASDTSLRTKLQEHIDAVQNDNLRDIYSRDPDRISNLDTKQNSPSSSKAPIQQTNWLIKRYSI